MADDSQQRESYRKAFSGFDAKKIARYEAKDAKRLLADPGIVRSRLKVAAAIQNAQQFLELRREFGSFDAYVWRFVSGAPIDHKIRATENDAGIRRYEQGLEETQIQVCRLDDLLRVVQLTRAGARAIERAFPLWEQAQKQSADLAGRDHFQRARESAKDLTRKLRRRREPAG